MVTQSKAGKLTPPEIPEPVVVEVEKDCQMLLLIKLATLSRVLSFGTSHVGKDFQIKVSH